MDVEIFRNKIVVCSEDNKHNILKECSNKLIYIKFLSMNELIKNYYFDYDKKTIFYLMKNYNINYEVAETYIKNLYYVDDTIYKNNKLNELVKIKKELIDNNLLIFNDLFKDYLKNKDIIIYECDFNKFNTNMIKEIKEIANIEITNKKYNHYDHKVIEFNTIDDEVNYVAYSISKLIHDGVDINSIKLANIASDYSNVINRIFSFYNIPVNLGINNSIYGTKVASDFIKYYDNDIANTINKLSKYKDTDAYNKIIKICNKYTFCNDYQEIFDMIIHDLRNTYLDNIRYDNEVEVIDLDCSIDNEYVFLMNFNLGQIPLIYKDTDYIEDSIKDGLLLENTIELNIRSKEKTINNINNIKNLVITYKLKTPTSDFYPSNLCDIYEKEIVDIDYKMSYSKLNDKIDLAKRYDSLIKYGVRSNLLNVLNSNYNIPYLTFNNKYTRVNTDNMYKLLKNKMTFSSTALSLYSGCAFSYYINNILKLNIFEDNFAAVLGTIFHKVLEEGLKHDINIDEIIKEEINSKYGNRSFTNAENHFIDKTKEDMLFVLDTIKEQMKHCSLDKMKNEYNVTIKKGKNLDVTFTGFIDKLLYREDNDTTYLAIVDYKTGATEIDLSYVPYGLHMQLPVYIYLAYNSEFKNVEIVGIYLQKVLHQIYNVDKKKTLEQQRKEDLKLEGYSNMDGNILSKIDDGYSNSDVIKSMKVNQDGSFNFNAKVLSSTKINKLRDITEEVIDKAIDNIENAKFDINPKIYENKDTACHFCKYKDICFKTKNDEVKIKQDKKLDYLGGDIDA